ncbi:hypothetical protein PR202_gb24463 [Eleusine coracana subsp. coracana]|uniref:Uncharacterized protein n=1 Tax=Eleusine coracana subsp. coracana TaxID=191504 RepID=A0AAV5FIR4_ELECO|nr:hypothetical protein PR202_gb24463 [Eleusine coracana subsp. coracana]
MGGGWTHEYSYLVQDGADRGQRRRQVQYPVPLHAQPNTSLLDSKSTIGVEFATKSPCRSAFFLWVTSMMEGKNDKGSDLGHSRTGEVPRTVPLQVPTTAAPGGSSARIYDITKRQSFDNVHRWLRELRDHADSSIVILMVGNKSDLTHLRAVSEDEGKALAETEGLFFLETSAMEAVNVEEAFQTIITEVYGIVNRKALAAKEAAAAAAPLPSQGKTISIDNTAGNTKRACCST